MSEIRVWRIVGIFVPEENRKLEDKPVLLPLGPRQTDLLGIEHGTSPSEDGG
jgi:hypothetical protein